MLFRQYWDWVGGNIGAMPLQFAITAIVTVVFSRPIAWLVSRVRPARDAVLDEAREDARKARAIAADLYERVTGERHEHAPARKG